MYLLRDGVEGNRMIRAQFSSVALSTMEESDAANKSLLSSVESKLRLTRTDNKKFQVACTLFLSKHKSFCI